MAPEPVGKKLSAKVAGKRPDKRSLSPLPKSRKRSAKESASPSPEPASKKAKKSSPPGPEREPSPEVSQAKDVDYENGLILANGKKQWIEEELALLWHARKKTSPPKSYREIQKRLLRSELSMRLKLHHMKRNQPRQKAPFPQPAAFYQGAAAGASAIALFTMANAAAARPPTPDFGAFAGPSVPASSADTAASAGPAVPASTAGPAASAGPTASATSASATAPASIPVRTRPRKRTPYAAQYFHFLSGGGSAAGPSTSAGPSASAGSSASASSAPTASSTTASPATSTIAASSDTQALDLLALAAEMCRNGEASSAAKGEAGRTARTSSPAEGEAGPSRGSVRFMLN